MIYLRFSSPGLIRPFRTPFFPIMPILGAVMCSVLLMSLMAGAATRNFFLIYLAGGIVIYFAYGIWHSKLGKGLSSKVTRPAHGAAARVGGAGRSVLSRRSTKFCLSKRRCRRCKTALAGGLQRRAGGPAGRGKDHGHAAGAAGQPWAGGGKLIVLEPRRLAARAAADADGGHPRRAGGPDRRLPREDGLRVSGRTRIEVVTEGVFTRMILDDPGLEGVAGGAVRRVPRAQPGRRPGPRLRPGQPGLLRPDLRLLVMSATLDGGRGGRRCWATRR